MGLYIEGDAAENLEAALSEGISDNRSAFTADNNSIGAADVWINIIGICHINSGLRYSLVVTFYAI